MGLFAIDLIGSGDSVGHRLFLTLALVGAVVAARLVLIGAVVAARRNPGDHPRFWVWQISNLAALICIVVGVLLIWSDSPQRLAGGLGIVGAGIAIAAQRVVTAFAGYVVILTGRAFTVGDRIKMGAVQGDVIALGFLQTRVLEMGQPTPVNDQESPGMWVRARQYSGRIVTVTNDKVFDEAVYNFTREFRFLWDEISIPVPYGANHELAEQIVLAAARDATSPLSTRAATRARRSISATRSISIGPNRASTGRSPITGSSSPSGFSSPGKVRARSRTGWRGRSCASSTRRTSRSRAPPSRSRSCRPWKCIRRRAKAPAHDTVSPRRWSATCTRDSWLPRWCGCFPVVFRGERAAIPLASGLSCFDPGRQCCRRRDAHGRDGARAAWSRIDASHR